MINLGVLQVVLKAKDQLSGKLKTVAGVALAAGAAILKFTKDTIELGTRLVDLSSATGVSIQALQELEFAGKQAGVGMKQISDVILRLGRRSAAELPETVKWLDKLGLSVEDITSSNPAAAFELVAAKLQAMGPGAQQAAAAMGILGDAGLQVLAAINQGLVGNIERFRELGVAMSDEAAQSAKQLGDTITDLEARWVGMKTSIGSVVIPALQNIVIFFADLLPGAIQTVIAKSAMFVASIVSNFQKAAAAIAIFDDRFVGVADTLGNMAAKVRDFGAGFQEMADVNFAAFGQSISESMNVAAEGIVVASEASGAGAEKFRMMGMTFDENAILAEKMRIETLRLMDLKPMFESVGAGGMVFAETLNEVGGLAQAEAAAMESAFANFGLRTQAQFDATAAQAVRDFAIIKASGQKTAAELEAIWAKMEAQRRADTAETSEFTITAAMDVVAGALTAFGQLGGKFKALAIAGAIIATFSAIAKALAAYPPPFSFVAAAAAGAAGFANVAKIQSAKPGFREGTPGLDFKNFGPETLIPLHGDEAVIPQGGGHQLAGEIASSLPAAGAGVGGGNVTIAPVIQIEGFGNLESAAQDIAPVVVRALMDNPEIKRQIEKIANG